MSRKGLELYGELFPPGTTRNAEYWTRHIGIIENYSGSAEHLGIMSALLDERLHFFRQESDSRNGLLLVLVCTASWELIRTLAGIGKDERDWLRKKHTQFEDHIYQENWADAIRFMEQMHSLYEIQTFNQTDSLITRTSTRVNPSSV